MEWKLSDELFVRLQEFTYLTYTSNPGTKDVNVLRYRLFCARKGELELHQLPPCQDTLRKHCERANNRSAIWRRSLQSSPQIPFPLALDCIQRIVNWLLTGWVGNGHPRLCLSSYPARVRESTSCQAVPVSLTDCIAMTCVGYRGVQTSQRKLQRI